MDEDFSKTPIYLSNEERPEAINKRELPGEDRAQIVETNLVKPSRGKETFEGVSDANKDGCKESKDTVTDA